jgi:hypothetical protein
LKEVAIQPVKFSAFPLAYSLSDTPRRHPTAPSACAAARYPHGSFTTEKEWTMDQQANVADGDGAQAPVDVVTTATTDNFNSVSQAARTLTAF